MGKLGFPAQPDPPPPILGARLGALENLITGHRSGWARKTLLIWLQRPHCSLSCTINSETRGDMFCPMQIIYAMTHCSRIDLLHSMRYISSLCKPEIRESYFLRWDEYPNEMKCESLCCEIKMLHHCCKHCKASQGHNEQTPSQALCAQGYSATESGFD